MRCTGNIGEGINNIHKGGGKQNMFTYLNRCWIQKIMLVCTIAFRYLQKSRCKNLTMLKAKILSQPIKDVDVLDGGFPRSARFCLKISINQKNYYLTLTLERRKFQ